MGFSVAEVATWTGGRLANEAALGDAAKSIRVERPAPLGGSKATDLAFFFARAYEKEIPSAAPGILITAEPFLKPLEASGLPLWKKTAVVSCPDPYLALAILSEKFAARLSSVAHLRMPEGTEIHPSAVVDRSARIGEGVRIGAGCVIEKDAQIGKGTVLYPHCYVGPEVRVGEACVFFSRVSVYEWTQIGDRVRLHSGVVLGADGFGYAPRRDGKTVTGHQKIFHLGRVVIGDDVEIGANSTVDRSTFGETRVDRMAKLDNLVHVGHNAQVAEGAIICGGTCLAGRASIGKFAVVGGICGISNDIHVGDGATVGAATLVSKDVPAGGMAVGNPQREFREHFKIHAMLNRLMAEREARRAGKEGEKK